MSDLFNLSGKIAVVTGASRGIGKAIAILLAKQGAHVILASRKIEALKEVEKEIQEDGNQATAIVCHTGHMESIAQFFAKIEEQFGNLDILVNNAAANPYFGPVLNMEEAAFDKTIDVNLKGTFFLSQKAALLMKAGGGGSIINIASINGISPPAMQGIYSITKAGLIAMTKSFAKELAPFGIRVNALAPGLTDTKFASAMTKDEKILKNIMPLIPLQRIAEPEEMAGAVLYFASSASSYTTGSVLIVDGGMIA